LFGLNIFGGDSEEVKSKPPEIISSKMKEHLSAEFIKEQEA
jgi:hypothetical protein